MCHAITNVSLNQVFSFNYSQDTANITAAQNLTKSNTINSTITVSSTSITTPSLTSTTTSIGTSTLPPEIHHLNFTSVWQAEEDGLDYIVVLWSEESHVNATQSDKWTLLVSKESGDNQSLIINSSCSRHNNSRHQVKLEKESLMQYRVSCNDKSHHEDLVLIKPCLSYDLRLYPPSGINHPIGETKLKPLIKCKFKLY
jgi:hypothetical protein